jgi:hypothetical protein
MTTLTTYGAGGYDPAKPNGNVIAVETFDAPADPTPAPPTIEAKVDAVMAAVAALVDDRPADAAAAIATVTDEGTPT